MMWHALMGMHKERVTPEETGMKRLQPAMGYEREPDSNSNSLGIPVRAICYRSDDMHASAGDLPLLLPCLLAVFEIHSQYLALK